MARGLDNFQGKAIAERNLVALFEETVRVGRLLDMDSENPAHARRRLQERQLKAVHHDLGARGIPYLADRSDVVHVGMGVHDGDYLEPEGLYLVEDLFRLPSRIYHKGLLRLLVTQNEAVGHELRNDDSLQQHLCTPLFPRSHRDVDSHHDMDPHTP